MNKAFAGEEQLADFTENIVEYLNRKIDEAFYPTYLETASDERLATSDLHLLVVSGGE